MKEHSCFQTVLDTGNFDIVPTGQGRTLFLNGQQVNVKNESDNDIFVLVKAIEDKPANGKS